MIPPADDSNHFVPVVIVGAGPVGLSLALGLARHGIRSTVLERNDATSEHSKAAGVHVRTREIFRRWGIEDRLVSGEQLLEELTLHDASGGGSTLFSADFRLLDHEADRPGLLMVPQSRTEQVLLKAVLDTGRSDVRFGAEVVDITQDGDRATLTVHEDGVERRIHAAFAIGCDGAGSTVREALGLPFEGLTYSIRPMLADVRVDDDRDKLPWPRMRNDRDGMTNGLRIQAGLWRVIRLERGAPHHRDEPTAGEVRQRAAQVLGDGSTEVVWASRFRIHRRSSPRFRVGRVLLAGDAAHVHSPAGGLGMNAGVQDAANLAWKLAHAVRGGDVERLLDSYEVERRAVVVDDVSPYTDFLTRMFIQTPALVRRFAFSTLGTLLRWSRIERRALRRTAMIDLDYPASPLLDARDRSSGKRLPDPPLQCGDGGRTRLYGLLPTGAAVLHVTDGAEPGPDLPVDRVIRIGSRGHRDPTGALRELLGGGAGWILVRPDAQIAWARRRNDSLAEAVDHALGRTR